MTFWEKLVWRLCVLLPIRLRTHTKNIWQISKGKTCALRSDGPLVSCSCAEAVQLYLWMSCFVSFGDFSFLVMLFSNVANFGENEAYPTAYVIIYCLCLPTGLCLYICKKKYIYICAWWERQFHIHTFVWCLCLETQHRDVRVSASERRLGKKRQSRVTLFCFTLWFEQLKSSQPRCLVQGRDVEGFHLVSISVLTLRPPLQATYLPNPQPRRLAACWAPLAKWSESVCKRTSFWK